MTAIDLLERCAANNIRLSANGERLRVEASAPVDAETKDALAKFKTELLAILGGQEPPPSAPAIPGRLSAPITLPGFPARQWSYQNGCWLGEKPDRPRTGRP